MGRKNILKIKKRGREIFSKRQKKEQRGTEKKKISKKGFKKIVSRKIPKKAKEGKEKGKRELLLKKKADVGSLAQNLLAQSVFKPRIKVIGIGGGGGSIVSEISRSLPRATFIIADTDLRSLKRKKGIKYFWFGQQFTHGLGTGANVNLASQLANQAIEKIEQLLEGSDIAIFIASLGGGVGSGATQVFAQVAQKKGIITVGILLLPFKFEGKHKTKIALKALQALRPSLNVSLVISNEKIFKIITADTPLIEAFSKVNKNLAESLESLIDLIYTPGLINIDFADLKTVLNDRGKLAFLNTIEEGGKDRAEKICKKILTNPLLYQPRFYIEKILFNIAGSEALSMQEVEKISRYIGEQNPKAKIIFGISKESHLKNKIRVTLLMTGSEKRESEAKKSFVQKKKKSIVKEEGGVAKQEKTVEKLEEIEPQKESVPESEQGMESLPSLLPLLNTESQLEQSGIKKMKVVEISGLSSKKTIRRTALEIKKAEELEQKRKLAQEKEWEIPAFLRKVKFDK